MSSGQASLFGPVPVPEQPEQESMQRFANVSRCKRYRPGLNRAWGPFSIPRNRHPDDQWLPRPAPVREVMFVGLNPSIADGLVDDPTIRRCIRFARDWGFGGLWMGNLFDWRATDPADLPVDETAIGSTCDAWLRWMRNQCEVCVVAWGAHPAAARRAPEVLELLGEVHALGLTKDGHPRHPLYLRADLRPIPYRTTEAAA